MNLGEEVDLEDYVSRPDKISAAEVCAVYPPLFQSFCYGAKECYDHNDCIYICSHYKFLYICLRLQPYAKKQVCMQ